MGCRSPAHPLRRRHAARRGRTRLAARTGRHAVPQRRRCDLSAHLGSRSGDPLHGVATQHGREPMRGDLAHDRGAALIMVIMTLFLLTSLSVALLLSSSSEVLTAANFTNQRAAVYAADAILERAMIDIAAAPDWGALAAGLIGSSFAEGPAAGVRALADGTEIDVGAIVNVAGCHKHSACTDAELDAVTPERPWGTNNPRWRLYSYGWLRDLLPEAAEGVPWYVALMVAEHPLGAGAIAVRAEAFGPRNAHSVVELTAARGDGDTDYNDGTTPRTVSWREVR